jgi:TATA-binding protein-associated factor
VSLQRQIPLPLKNVSRHNLQFTIATARAARRLNASHKLILTGTPIMNKVDELWATFDFLMPNFLGTSRYFTTEFAAPITKSQRPNASAQTIADGTKKLRVLHQQVLPFILRREKDQVLTELPDLTVSVVRVPMSALQARIYKDFCARGDAINLLNSLEMLCEDQKQDVKLDNPNVGANVLRSLLFLRLLCTHPSLVLTRSQREEAPSSWSELHASGKVLALSQLLKEAGIYEETLTGADNDTTALYCFDDLDEDGTISGSDDKADDHFGSLAAAWMGSARLARSKARKCLIFAQFGKTLDALEKLLFLPHMPSLQYVRLDGTVGPDKRQKVVESFNDNPQIKVMILTTRVGGLGLNLQVADTVFFLENDFNPFADIQAIDRTRRIGQKHAVNVYKIVTTDSIEEKILDLQAKKVEIANAVVNSDNSTMFSMGTDRLLDIFAVNGSAELSNEYSDCMEYDLEGLIDQCADDYGSLSVDQFSESLSTGAKIR